jgi:hypothetical protein
MEMDLARAFERALPFAEDFPTSLAKRFPPSD